MGVILKAGAWKKNKNSNNAPTRDLNLDRHIDSKIKAASHVAGVQNGDDVSFASLVALGATNNEENMIIKFPAGTAETYGSLLFQGNDGTWNIKYAQIKGGVESWGSDDGFIAFRTSNNAVLAEKMRLTAAGRLQVEKDIEILTAGDGIIIPSPDSTRYRITVANGGAVTSTPV
jgi:hypothetical protein